jgi:signal peptidase II
MKIKYLLLLAISGAVITIDQVVKMYVHTHFHLQEEMVVLPKFFNLTYLQNTGAAFGIFAELPPAYREVFFLVMPPIALLIILMLLRQYKEGDRAGIVALSLVFGGAIGNYIDRLRFHYVIDFLDFHIDEAYHWPAFNVADMAIVVGVGLLMFLEWGKLRSKQTTPPAVV